jgi:GntR family transcriptional regulator
MARDRRALPLQVRDAVRAYLRDEGLSPGARLPSEDDLAVRFEVSRSTLREALRLLEQDGILDVRHGDGRYVSPLPTVERPITRLEGTTELLRSMGYEVSDRVLDVSVGAPSEDEARALRLPSSAEVIHLERVRLERTEPLTYSRVTMPRTLFRGPIGTYDWSLPLHQVLDSLGQRSMAANTQIKAAHLPRQVARATGLPGSVPYLLLVQTVISRTGVLLMYAHDYMRGDHFSYDVRRVRD